MPEAEITVLSNRHKLHMYEMDMPVYVMTGHGKGVLEHSEQRYATKRNDSQQCVSLFRHGSIKCESAGVRVSKLPDMHAFVCLHHLHVLILCYIQFNM